MRECYECGAPENSTDGNYDDQGEFLCQACARTIRREERNRQREFKRDVKMYERASKRAESRASMRNLGCMLLLGGGGVIVVVLGKGMKHTPGSLLIMAGLAVGGLWLLLANSEK